MSCRIVTIVVNHAPIDAVAKPEQVCSQYPNEAAEVSSNAPHSFVHIDGRFIRDANEEVHEPSVLLLARLVQMCSQCLGKAHLPVLGSNSKTGNVTVPGQVFVRAQKLHVVWILFDFPHDCGIKFNVRQEY